MATLNELVAGINAAKAEWEIAAKKGDAAGKAAAHAKAEALRAQVGFSGGADGSKYIELPKPAAAPVTPDPVPAAAPVPEPVSRPAVRDLTADIQALYAAQRNSRLASLAKARDSALSALSGEQGKLAPQFYAARNNTQSQADIGARNFAAYMAARGSSGNGAAAQARISQEGVLQGQLGNLQGQEIAANTDINRRMTDVQAGYANDSYAAESDVAAAEAAARIAEMQRVDGINLSQWNADRSYDRGIVESDRSYELQKKSTEASLAAQELDSQLKKEAARLAADPNSPDNRLKSLQIQSAQVELASALELAKYAPAEAAARIAQIKASAAASWASASNTRADNTRADDGAAWDRFLATWKASGRAPANSFGITEGTVYAPDASSGTSKPADLPGIRDTIVAGLNGTGVKSFDARGNEITVQVQKMTAASAVDYLRTMVANGQISQSDADWIAESIPGVAAYLTAQLARGASQTRY